MAARDVQMRTNYEGSWEKTVLPHQKSIHYQTFWFGFHLALTKQVVGLTVHFKSKWNAQK